MILRQEGDGDDRHQPPPLQGNRPGGCQRDSDATQWQQRGYYAHSGQRALPAGLRVRVAAPWLPRRGPGQGADAPWQLRRGQPPAAASGAGLSPARFGVLES